MSEDVIDPLDAASAVLEELKRQRAEGVRSFVYGRFHT